MTRAGAARSWCRRPWCASTGARCSTSTRRCCRPSAARACTARACTARCSPRARAGRGPACTLWTPPTTPGPSWRRRSCAWRPRTRRPRSPRACWRRRGARAACRAPAPQPAPLGAHAQPPCRPRPRPRPPPGAAGSPAAALLWRSPSVGVPRGGCRAGCRACTRCALPGLSARPCQEHALYPEAVAALVDGRITWRADGVPIMWTAH